MLQALGTIKIRFLQKKSKKKFHACVPLILTTHTASDRMDSWMVTWRGEVSQGLDRIQQQVRWQDDQFNFSVFSHSF